MRNPRAMFPGKAAVLAALTAGLAVSGMLAAAVLAPVEATMGDAQRIVYIHVAVAWLGLLAFLVMAVTGLLYLIHRDLIWDTWAGAAAELGWLCSSLTLATGSLWAHAAWQTWWTWDPRLTTSFILWMVYSGCLLARGSISDPHQRARIGAVLALLGALDLPLVVMATRWFRGIHPVTPEMEPAMRVALLLSVTGLTALFALLLVRRQAQLALHNSLVTLLQQLDR